jgi:hypothetical protein
MRPKGPAIIMYLAVTLLLTHSLAAATLLSHFSIKSPQLTFPAQQGYATKPRPQGLGQLGQAPLKLAEK